MCTTFGKLACNIADAKKTFYNEHFLKIIPTPMTVTFLLMTKVSL